MMRLNNRIRNSFFVIAMSALATACGGGGGGSAAAAELPGGTSAAGNPIIDSEQNGPTGNGHALLTWEAPNAREDGSCLSEDLKAYRINYGLAPGVYDSQQTVEAAAVGCVDTGKTDACGQVRSCSFMVDDLGTASWYFAVQAIDSAGNVSGYSNEGVKTVQ